MFPSFLAPSPEDHYVYHIVIVIRQLFLQTTQNSEGMRIVFTFLPLKREDE